MNWPSSITSLGSRPRSTSAWLFFCATLSGLLATNLATAAVFNVANYGATGTGVTDDTIAIQKTITAAKAACAGSVVYFPSGNYLYSATFTFDSIAVQGAASASTTLIAADSNNSALTLTGTNPAASGLTITTKTAPVARNTNPAGTGIHVYKANGFTISNIKINHIASAGILVRQSTGPASGGYAQIQNCEIMRTLADGINVTQVSSSIEIHDNYVHDTGDDFVGIVSYRGDLGICSTILVHNNTCERQTNGRGIGLVGGSNVEIYHNRVINSSGSGIYLASEANYDTYGVDGVKVYNNLIKNCPKAVIAGHAGMTFSGRVNPANSTATDLWVTNVTVDDNTVMNSATYGMVVGACSRSVTLTLNNVAFTTYDGIVLAKGSSFTTCTGNTVMQTGGNGISVQSGANNVAIVADPVTGFGNTICNTGLYGIYVDATASTATIDITENIIDSVNQKKTSYIDVINVSGIGPGAKISIQKNRYLNSTNGPVERLIEAISTPLTQVSGNTTMVVLPSIYTLL